MLIGKDPATDSTGLFFLHPLDFEIGLKSNLDPCFPIGTYLKASPSGYRFYGADGSALV